MTAIVQTQRALPGKGVHSFIWPLNLNLKGGQSRRRDISKQRFTRLQEKGSNPP